jgi:DNA helicase-2/ATP-dependent DNA helicase PcrA
MPGLELPAMLRQPLPELVLEISRNFVKRAKDYRMAPYQLEEMVQQRGESLPLARLGLDIYRDYQNRLARTGVDFDDLIRLAAQAIELDPDFLSRLRQRWPYILEDEAQDSSQLQQHILEALTGPTGAWVRVGDPNQAIYETFTTADPEHLRGFLRREGVISLPMPESGRSSPSIMRLANHLIDWTIDDHPRDGVRDALSLPYIEPTPPGDPQPNPPDRPDQIHFRSEKFKPPQEIQALVRSVKQWLKQNPTKTVAILDARNKRGVDMANALRRADVPYVELLNSTAATRSTAGVLGNVLRYLARPEDSRQLATVFHVWKRHEWDLEDLQPIYQQVEAVIQNAPHLEDYLWPRPGHNWLENQAEIVLPVEDSQRSGESQEGGEDNFSPQRFILSLLTQFRELVRRWQQAAILPIDQLILLLAQDLFDSPADLALAHKFAVVLRRIAAEHPDYRLPEFVEELAEIARNQRRFLGFDEDMVGFEPPPGKVTVATMHRAKGLEWDRVYLMGLNNYSFPSGQPQDTYFSEKWFVRDSLNLEAEVLAQLEALINHEGYVEGAATEAARLDLVRERLRLFFVGLTRARLELIVTWNTGQQYANKSDNQPAIPFVALQTWGENQK